MIVIKRYMDLKRAGLIRGFWLPLSKRFCWIRRSL